MGFADLCFFISHGFTVAKIFYCFNQFDEDDKCCCCCLRKNKKDIAF